MKRNQFHTVLSLFLVATLMGGTHTAWSKTKKDKPKTNQSITWQEFSEFDPQWNYKIHFKDKRKTLSINGANLSKQGNQLQISGITPENISLNQIKNIQGKGRQRVGSHMLEGSLYGTGIGLLLGFGLGLPAAMVNCDNPNCDWQLGSLVVAIPTLVGASIGLGIGAAIPKKPKVMITPNLSKSRENTQVGLGLNLPW